MIKALVTGSNGHQGANLVRDLLERRILVAVQTEAALDHLALLVVQF